MIIAALRVTGRRNRIRLTTRSDTLSINTETFAPFENLISLSALEFFLRPPHRSAGKVDAAPQGGFTLAWKQEGSGAHQKKNTTVPGSPAMWAGDFPMAKGIEA